MIPHNQPIIVIIPGLNEKGSAVRNFHTPMDAIEFLMENTEAPPMYAYDPAIGQEKSEATLTIKNPEPERFTISTAKASTVNLGHVVNSAGAREALADSLYESSPVEDPNAAMLMRDGPEEDVCTAEPEEVAPEFPQRALDHASPFK